MKQRFLFLLLIGIILFSSFIKPKVVKENLAGLIIADSIPTTSSTIQLDSVWVQSGYGWTHHTYHWIPAHWQVTKKRVTASTPAKNSDSTQTAATDLTQPKQTKVWIKGHREFIHNNWVWVSGHWQTQTMTAK
ncbi:MAG TPA: hypothetical protein VK705_06385 [Ferruginibacter sp.]|nr:hypothetical protein [Ferruginibacter sp.]